MDGLIRIVIACIAALTLAAMTAAVAEAAESERGLRAPSTIALASIRTGEDGVDVSLSGYLPTRCWAHDSTAVTIDEKRQQVKIEPWKRKLNHSFCPPGFEPFTDQVGVALAPGTWRISFAGFAPTRLVTVSR